MNYRLPTAAKTFTSSLRRSTSRTPTAVVYCIQPHAAVASICGLSKPADAVICSIRRLSRTPNAVIYNVHSFSRSTKAVVAGIHRLSRSAHAVNYNILERSRTNVSPTFPWCF